MREQTCPEIRNLSRNKGLFLGYGAIWGDGISGRVFLFLDASSWSGRPGGRAGEQARASKIISGDVFLFLDASSWSGRPGGRAGGRARAIAKLFLETSSNFWTRLPGAGGRAGGRASKGYSKIISGRVFLERAAGRPGGRARASKIISGDVFLFLDASSWSGRPGGRAGEQGL